MPASLPHCEVLERTQPQPMAFDGSRAEYYRERARQVRDIAQARKSPSIREQFETIAQQFDDLARDVEEGRLKP